MAPPAANRGAWIVLASITLVALGLRCAGIDRLLPHRPEPDPFVVLQVQELEGDPTKSWESHYFERYPLLLARTLALWPDPPLPRPIAAADRDDAEKVKGAHLAGASAPFLRVRIVAALCSALLAPLTYFLARRFLRTPAALLAAGLVATSLLSMLYAHQGRPHTIAAMLALATVLAALRACERRTWTSTILAGLLAATVLATLQPGVFALPPVAVALWLAHRGQPIWRRWPALAVPLAAVVLAGLFYSNRPYIDETGLHLATAERGGHSISPSDWNGRGFPRGARHLWQHDPLLAGGAAIGVVFALVMLVRRRKELTGAARDRLAIVLAYALPYALIVGANGEIYERFLIPLLPYCALLSAAWIDALASGIGMRLRASLARAAVIAVSYGAALAFPTFAAVCYARAASLPDTQEQAARWIAHSGNVAADARILTGPGLFLPLLMDPESLAANLADPSWRLAPWIQYQKLVPEEDLRRFGRPIQVFPRDLAFPKGGVEPDPSAVEPKIEELGVDYVVIEHSPLGHNWPILVRLREVAEARGDLVFRARGAAPAVAERGLLDYQAVNDLALRILHTRAFGPGIDVYRIRR